MTDFTDILNRLSTGSDLSFEEATFALNKIISGDVSESRIAAFLFGMRMKGETIDELTAFVKVMREAAIHVDVNTQHAVDMCGTGGDHSNTFNISTGAMFVVAGAGVPVLKHGNRSISSNSGSADVLEALGVKALLPPEKIAVCYKQSDMAFMFAPYHHPAMKYVMPARKSLAMRTFFNILGPLMNPAGVKRQLIGAYNRETAETMIRILANLGTEFAYTVNAHDGLDEFSTTSQSDVFVLKNSVHSESILFDPETLGYKRSVMDDLQGGDSHANAVIISDILNGTGDRFHCDIVELNATFALHASGKFANLTEAGNAARESLTSGAAANALKRFVECSNDLSD
ncbi:MAG: anthranilate phosphoribosyltransferase [Rhodothermaceae bacterium]|nr:anthranilate phosphoribosyltransferase [Rhodothermaceae bacterium]